MSTFANNSGHRRSGQALIEFAVVAFVTTILFAAILSFGLLIFGANVLQQAVDVGAQELARMPLPAAMEFGDSLYDAGTVLSDPTVLEQLFDEQFLVIDISSDGSGDLPANWTADDLENYFADMPLINRLLRPLMIVDVTTISGNERRLLRYPGTLVLSRDPHPVTMQRELSVLIPVVGSRDPVTGVESITEWRSVVEEVRSNGNGPFSIAAADAGNPAFQPGVVALRMNYPYQSGALVGVRYMDTSGTPLSPEDARTQDVVNWPIIADDAGVTVAPLDDYTLVVTPGDGVGPNSGAYGLGRQYITYPATIRPSDRLLSSGRLSVRPYRKLISTQAIYRREVFE